MSFELHATCCEENSPFEPIAKSIVPRLEFGPSVTDDIIAIRQVVRMPKYADIGVQILQGMFGVVRINCRCIVTCVDI
jgi:hypothetical protein